MPAFEWLCFVQQTPYTLQFTLTLLFGQFSFNQVHSQSLLILLNEAHKQATGALQSTIPGPPDLHFKHCTQWQQQLTKIVNIWSHPSTVWQFLQVIWCLMVSADKYCQNWCSLFTRVIPTKLQRYLLASDKNEIFDTI